MPVGLLVVFKYVLIALIWLFFLRALRAVYVQVRQPKEKRVKEVAPQPLAEVAPARSKRSAAPKDSSRGSTSSKLRLGLKSASDSDDGGKIWPVESFVTIGRSTGCTISIPDDEFSSSVHCRLTKTDSNFLIEDLGSTNGTYLNGALVRTPVEVAEGDEISAGRSRFKVVRI
ncbi:MAG: FHA domain-containing protein [Actinomycetota bacterium]|nr:FHA domain-containing protein [Actinomycetota bacterium]